MVASTVSAHVLDSFLDGRRKMLSDIAQSWLDSGATAFGISDEGRWLALWPDSAVTGSEGAHASLKMNNRIVADLWVFGLSDGSTRQRLETDAQLIGQIAGQDDELNNVTYELIDAQDQLLALYDLTQSMRNRLSVDDALITLVQEIGRLVKATGCAGYLAFDPPVVLADEPSASLDSAATADLISILADLAKEGRTVVVATHDPDILAASHATFVLQHGRLNAAVQGAAA